MPFFPGCVIISLVPRVIDIIKEEKIMKKRNYVIAAASALALALTACGGGAKDETIAATEASVEATDAVNADDNTAEAEGDVTEEAKEEESDAAESSEEAEVKETPQEFADLVADAVMNKDLKDLADMVTYPVYVASVKDNEGIVADKEAFLALDKDSLFTEEFSDAVTAFDTTTLEEVEAGYVMGSDGKNITFKADDNGKLGITGINN